MSDLAQRVANLSPEKHALLMMRLKQAKTSKPQIIPRRPVMDPAPLSFAQQRLWFIDQLEPNSPLYNIPAALLLTGALDVDALTRSLNAIVRRHESLRTTFATVGDLPVQVIAPEFDLSLPITDLHDLPKEKRGAEAFRIATEEAQCPFDLARGPLLRVRLLKLTDDEHVLLVTMHHIISDGWSLGVLVKEFATLYSAFSTGKSSGLLDLPIQYADFAAWQRTSLKGETLDTQLAYWKQQLGGELPVLQLPTDRPRPAAQSNRGAQCGFMLPHDLLSALQTLSRQEDVTLFMTLLGAFQILLYRYTGQKDFCVGTPIANRNRSELEGLIGFFVNTLVLRADLSGEPTFRDLLKRVRPMTLDAFAHQDVPFEMLVDTLQPERSLSHTPLFQTMFVLQNAPLPDLQLPNLTISRLPVHSGTSTFDLTLMLEEKPNGLHGTIEYAGDLFDAATITRFIAHYRNILEGIAAHPDQSIATLPLLSEAEQQQLSKWNQTATEYARDQCMHHLFQAQAKRTPDAIAVQFEGEPLTYRELNRRANQLAQHLQKLGVVPDTLVGICVARSFELPIALLAVLKAGGAYLPLDPTYPADRLAFMLEDSGAPIVLTQAPLVERFRHSPFAIRHFICLDTDWNSIARECDTDPASNVTPENLAYVIYTSGSTGKPKGVLVPHRAVVNHNLAVAQAFRLDARDRVLQFSTICFDAAVEEIFPAWSVGARIVLRPEPLPTLREFHQFIEREQVTVLDLPTAYWQTWVAELQATGERVPPSVRLVVVGGEKASAEKLAEWFQVAGKNIAWMNTYGPTEATVIATLYQAKPDQADLRDVPIGRPIANAQTYVLDPYLQPVPIGVPGELHIGGVCLARGYLNRPELTAEKFITVNSQQSTVNSVHCSLFTDNCSLRLYKTGDLARYLPDGNLEFIGRADDQVKVRGFRVELSEIEVTLEQHPTVKQAAVIARDDSGVNRLVAYVATDDGRPTTVDLREFLRAKLPEYMIPSAFVVLDSLPTLPSGKVNRRALPAPEPIADEGAFVAPRTPIEEILAGLWANLLGVERVSIHDNFFNLGGHSLLATQVISRVRAAFNIELPLRALFESPTLAEFARQIENAQRAPAPSIQRGARDGRLPLSFAQQRLWFLDQLEPNNPLYNIAAAVRLKGSLDVGALEHALNEIVRRHESLRTTFPVVNGQPSQVIAPQLMIALPQTDLRALPESERESEMRRLAKEHARQPFDLARGPLLRVHLLQLADDVWVVLLAIHHIISDGWSTGVLTRQLAAIYQAQVNGEPLALAEPQIQYADFAAWQRAWLNDETLQDQRTYWKEQLAGELPVLNLPTDRPRPALQTFNGACHTFALSEALTRGLKTSSHREGATLFMTLLAAFQTVLYRYTGQTDMSVGTVIANRNRAEIEELIGFFVNTLVLRTDLGGEPSFRELLKRVREVALGAYAHQDVPFEMIVDAVQPKRNLSHTPLFQVMFALQNAPDPSLEFPGVISQPVEIETGTAKFDLTLIFEEKGNQLIGTLEYNTDLFDAATIARMAGHLQTILENAVAHPDQSIATMPMLTEAEEHQLLIEWNDTRADLPLDDCAHHLFQAHVERAPDALAIATQDQQLTYRELNQRANQLAHYLQKLGVAPDVLVGICMERSIELVIAALGVLKAGGAYVPLDPTVPPERLTYMLTDAQSPVLLTHSGLVTNLGLSLANTKIVCLDTDWHVIARERAENPANHVTCANLAYMIYTSGSTGLPKGVQIEHRSLLNLVYWHQRAFAVSPKDRATLISGPGFDASVWELWSYLCAGASIHIPDDETRAAPTQLRDWLAAQSITITFLPTPLAEAVVALDWRNDTPLRTLLTGGDKLHAYPSHTLPFQLSNNYGPTEYTVVTTSGIVAPTTRADVPPTIGRPIANTQVYILDAHSQIVPIGVPGELHIGGAGLARGYLNRPQLTAEKFITVNRIHCSLRLYKTGDLVRYRANGEIEFLGRIDHQVKVRGFRIELGEIEAVLGQHPAVREVIVIARDAEREQEGKRLVAYVVMTQPVGIGELREFLRAKLPDYMAPSAFVFMDALPLTPNGKVDRRALPAPDQSHLASEFTAPRTRTEEILADIWTQVLGVARVGVHDNFFELGGDSILSIQVVARANHAGLSLTPKQLFQNPTVAQLAQVAGASRATLVRAEQGIVTGKVLLTPIQRWFFEQNFVEPHHWNQAVLFQVREPLQRESLEQAVAHLLLHHDALRTRFTRDESGWRADVSPKPETTAVEWFDLNISSESEQSRIIETRTAELQASLNFTQGQLMRVAYFDLGAERSGRLFIAVHHLSVDNVAWRILIQDLLTAYTQARRGERVQVPPKTTSFQYWAQRLNEYAQTDAVRAETDYWLDTLNTAECNLPTDVRGENIEASAGSVRAVLDADSTHALLRHVLAAYHAEINDVLLTALAQTVACWTGARALLVDLEGHGREDLFADVDVSRTLGWFTSVYPVRLELNATTPGHALKSVQEQLRRVPHHGIGFGLLRYLNRESTAQLAASPHAPVSFNYLGQLDAILPASAPFSLSREPIGAERSPRGQRTHLLDISAAIVGGELQVEWTYSENIHRRETIERVARDFIAALRGLLAQSQSPEARDYAPSDFDLELTQAEMDALIAETSAE
ncbi:MAG: amino acid adenylation domain-containing protein [Chloroflexi bacterium]|nr:amino acid adenylation domain-containing protein [Chloroflexota bacterium]